MSSIDLRALDEAATEAPWHPDPLGWGIFLDDPDTTDPDDLRRLYDADMGAIPDAAFIADFRNAAPYLLDIVAAAQAFINDYTNFDRATDVKLALDALREAGYTVGEPSAVRAMYTRLAKDHQAEPAVPDRAGGVIGDRYTVGEP